MKHIYVITIPGHPYCKIGLAGDLKKRLAGLQTGNPYRLEVASTTKVDADIADLVELEAHKILEDHKTMGEWFEVSADQAYAAINKAVSTILSQAVSPLTPLEKAIKIVGSQSAFARCLGVKQAHVWYWLRKSVHCVPAEHVISIERATDGRVTRHELRPDIYPHEENAAA